MISQGNKTLRKRCYPNYKIFNDFKCVMHVAHAPELSLSYKYSPVADFRKTDKPTMSELSYVEEGTFVCNFKMNALLKECSLSLKVSSLGLASTLITYVIFLCLK